MSTAEIATNSTLAIEPTQTDWTGKQIAALAQLGVDKASPGDLSVFFHQCQRSGLDPFARQIYMIGRNSKNQDTNRWETKYTIQTGIDGFRLIARRATDRSRGVLGYEDTLWCGEDGQWRDVWLSQEPPRAAKVTVTRDGQFYPAVALMSEYAGTTKTGDLTKMWREKPAGQLAKCAEALALRKAFPQDLAGLHTADEMESSASTMPVERLRGSQPRTILEAAAAVTPPSSAGEKPDTPTVDVDNLLDAIAATDNADALREIWRTAAGLPENEATTVRDLVTTRIEQLRELNAQTESEATEQES